MGSVQQSGVVEGRIVVETRARMIGDPVAKLRYLQSAMREAEPKPAIGGRMRWWQFGSLAVVGLLLVPLPTVSDVHSPALSPVGSEMPPLNLAKLARSTRPNVWLVDDHGSYEVYSNGLRVENHHVVGNEERSYPVYDRETLELVEWKQGPVGIIYHTTESQQAPFSSTHNERLQRLGQWLREFVQRKRAYHFVVDRFGQVHRVVRETHSANHAGYSIWADRKYTYVNLNPSFLGISFETQTKESAAGATINGAQVRAATVLTEMLRSKYGIRAENCVSHAQVSVFSRSMRVGNHTDWAAGFPFAEIGLGDNYGLPLAAVSIFGFKYGLPYMQATGPDLWRGLAMGENNLRLQAARAGQTIDEYRSVRKRRYREILKAIEDTISSEESES
jgi:N-acetylmuramoyl-L-alanine amidase-like protein